MSNAQTAQETQNGANMKNKSIKIAIAVILVTALVLSACGPEATPPPPTPDLNALSTQVAQTVVARITQTAAAYTPPATETVAASPTPEISATPAATATINPATCDDAKFVSDISVPDGTQMSPGQKFTKTWQIRNAGPCTWNAAYTLNYGYGSSTEAKMGGQAVALTGDVKTGEMVEVSVNLTAPNKVGTYSGYWRMRNSNGSNFGDFFTVVIIVK
jgi:hypothetical protein